MPKTNSTQEAKFALIKANLQNGVEHIYSRHSLSSARYVELYDLIHQFCTTPSPSYPGEAQYAGKEVYEYFTQFTQNYASQVYKDIVVSEDVLKIYVNQWENYDLSSSTLNSIGSFINRHYLNRLRDEGLREFFTVYGMAMESWKVFVHQKLENVLTKAVLKLIENERNGELIDTRLISITVKSYVSVGGFKDCVINPAKQDLSIYKSTIEKKLLEDTTDFYRKESSKFLAENSVSDCMKRVGGLINEEEKRVKDYLHESTLQPLIQKCYAVLIESKIEFLKADFKMMLTDERLGDLKRMYKLVSKIPSSLNELLVTFESHIDEQGKLAIEKCGKSVVNDPKIFVDTILQVHQKYSELVSTVFNDHFDFVKAFDGGCAKFINNNFVTKVENSSSVKTSDLIARYCDTLLEERQKSSEGSGIEDIFNQIMVVFKYVEDKDVFQQYHSKLSAERVN